MSTFTDLLDIKRLTDNKRFSIEVMQHPHFNMLINVSVSETGGKSTTTSLINSEEGDVKVLYKKLPNGLESYEHATTFFEKISKNHASHILECM